MGVVRVGRPHPAGLRSMVSLNMGPGRRLLRDDGGSWPPGGTSDSRMIVSRTTGGDGVAARTWPSLSSRAILRATELTYLTPLGSTLVGWLVSDASWAGCGTKVVQMECVWDVRGEAEKLYRAGRGLVAVRLVTSVVFAECVKCWW
jgi:hypothetical protein